MSDLDLDQVINTLQRVSRHEKKKKAKMVKKGVVDNSEVVRSLDQLNETIKNGAGAIWAVYHKLLKGECGIKIYDYTEEEETCPVCGEDEDECDCLAIDKLCPECQKPWKHCICGNNTHEEVAPKVVELELPEDYFCPICKFRVSDCICDIDGNPNPKKSCDCVGLEVCSICDLDEDEDEDHELIDGELGMQFIDELDHEDEDENRGINHGRLIYKSINPLYPPVCKLRSLLWGHMLELKLQGKSFAVIAKALNEECWDTTTRVAEWSGPLVIKEWNKMQKCIMG